MKRLLLILCILFAFVGTAEAAKYVRSGASGNGSDWNNAYGSLPATLTRGETYYIADGSYGSYTFNTPASGSQYITIKKATIADHGTGTGWSDGYGDGVATFGGLIFSTGYYIFDGMKGEGASDLPGYVEYGFQVKHTAGGDNDKLFNFTSSSASNIVIRHVESAFSNTPSSGTWYKGMDVIYSYGTNISFEYCWLHDGGRVIALILDSNFTFDHCVLERNAQAQRAMKWNPDEHSEIVMVRSGVNNFTLRYSFIRDWRSTGGIIFYDNNKNAKVYGNVFTQSGTYTESDANGVLNGLTAGTGSTVVVYNNTFANINYGCSLLTMGSYSSRTVKNNMFYSCKSNGGKNNAAIDGTITHNWFYDSGSAGTSVQLGSSDPFVNRAGKNFRLKVATDSGDTGIGTEYKTDPDGKTRGLDGVWDRGAYEFVGGGAEDRDYAGNINKIPSASLPCSTNPRNVTHGLTSLEPAVCKWGTGSPAGSTMAQRFNNLPNTYPSTSNNTVHSFTESLECGANYTRYFVCRDLAYPPNYMDAVDRIDFSIQVEAVNSPPQMSNPKPAGETFECGANVDLSVQAVDEDQPVTCRFDSVDTTFANMRYTFDYEAPPIPTPSITQPLTINLTNRRYFDDGTGKAVLLAGSHTWCGIQGVEDWCDTGDTPKYFSDFLDYVKSYGHNFIRLWTNNSTVGWFPYAVNRPGPGTAPMDGGKKFNFTSHNQDYFDMLYAKVAEAQSKGIYVSVMLFGTGVEMRDDDDWTYSSWMENNNINDALAAAFDSHGYSFYTTNASALEIQKLFVKKTIDTLNDLDNVIWEIINEPELSRASTWIQGMVSYIRSYEATKSKQHPIWWSSSGWGESDLITINSTADIGGVGNDPTFHWLTFSSTSDINNYNKPVIWDNDHIIGCIPDKDEPAVRTGIWKAFTRGLMPIHMDAYNTNVDPNMGWECTNTGSIRTLWDTIRRSLGKIVDYAYKIDLKNMPPSTTVSSTTFALASPGKEYFIYSPTKTNITVALSGITGTFAVEKYDVDTGNVSTSTDIEGGATRTITPPGNGSFTVWLKLRESVHTGHHATLTSPACGMSYTYYSRCIDGKNNANTTSQVHTFTVSGGSVPLGTQFITPLDCSRTGPMVDALPYPLYPYWVMWTTEADHGEVMCQFMIGEEGTYRLYQLTHAVDSGKDSLFLKVDDTGGREDAYIYDFHPGETYPISSLGYAYVYANLRGNGTEDSPQYRPALWHFTPGLHSITFYGREAFAGFGRFRFECIDCGASAAAKGLMIIDGDGVGTVGVNRTYDKGRFGLF